MSIHSVYNAQTHLSSLIEQACAGEEIIIARGKRAMVKLVPLQNNDGKHRQFGAMRGQAVVGEAFFDPLPEEELSAWDASI